MNKHRHQVAASVFILFLTSLSVFGQNNYLLSFQHKGVHGIEHFYFYLEQPENTSLIDTIKSEFQINLNNKVYSILAIRFWANIYSKSIRCCIGSALMDSLITRKDKIQLDSLSKNYLQVEAEIKYKYGFGLKEKVSAFVERKINKFDKIRLYKIDIPYCRCQVSKIDNDISSLSNSLLMPSSSNFAIYRFTPEEKLLMKQAISTILQNPYIQSCLPDQKKYLR